MMTSTLSQAYLGSLSPSHLVGRYQGLHGVAYTIGTGAGPLVGGAVYALGPWALWVLIGVVGVLSAQLSLPSRRAKSKVDVAQVVRSEQERDRE
jgi:MFS family permease